MIARILTAGIQGVDAFSVDVEVNAYGKFSLQETCQIIGLPDGAIRESRSRVKSALVHSGVETTKPHTIISLGPAAVKKEGAGFDLPIALGLAATTDSLDRNLIRGLMAVGELSLSGDLRPVNGILSIALHAKATKMRALLVPQSNVKEASLVPGLAVFGFNHLREVINFLKNQQAYQPHPTTDLNLYLKQFEEGQDFADVKGHRLPKRAAEIAAAGAHNLLMIGPPGSGKSMIARRLAGILPRLTMEEALESTRIHSIGGQLPMDRPMISTRPFRSPHHTISDAGLLGGGTNPRPGEVTFAHNGLLFLDELPEFKRTALEVLRQPLEDRFVTISRVAGSCQFPCNFMLVAAMNPCPCGYYGSEQHACNCSFNQIHSYRSKISGPLLDRIDLHVEVNQLSTQELLHPANGESSLAIAARVQAARECQQRRFAGSGTRNNANMTPKQIQQFCKMSVRDTEYMKHIIDSLHLSARSYDRILKVARTIADLNSRAEITQDDLMEAVQYRSLDRTKW